MTIIPLLTATNALARADMVQIHSVAAQDIKRTTIGAIADFAAAAALASGQPYVDLAKAWAQSPTPPDPLDVTSKSSKTWATAAAASAVTAALYGGVQVDTLPDLYALTSGQVAVGQWVLVRSINAVFKRLASGGDLAHTASVLAWEVQIGAGGFDFRAFGAVGGATNDLASMNAVVARLNTISVAARVTVVGEYTITGTPNPITTPGKFFVCYGGQINHDAGTLFTFGSGSPNAFNGGGVLGLKYLVPVAATAGTCFCKQDGGYRLVFQDIEGRANIMHQAGLAVAEAANYCYENINVGVVNNGQIFFDHGIGAVSVLRNVIATVNGTNRVLDETTLTGATVKFADFGKERWDTIIWDGILANGFSYALFVDRVALNKNVSNGKFSNCFFDYCANGIHLVNTLGGGGINNLTFKNCWVFAMDGVGVHLPAGTGSHRNITFENCEFLASGKNAVRLASTGMERVVFNNCKLWYSNRLNGTNAGNDRDDFVAFAGGWEMINCSMGKSANNIVAAGVPNWQGRYGATVSPNIGPWRFENNTVDGLTAPTQLAAGSTTTLVGNARACRVLGNTTATGAAAVNYAVSNIIAAPTTAVTQTNLTPFWLQLSIFGGTMTQIQHEGVQIAGAAGATFVVGPGETWRVDYTVAPTITRIVKP